MVEVIDVTSHPADVIDVGDAALRFWQSLVGGEHWDRLMVSLKPELANSGSELVHYTFDACVDEGLADDPEMDPLSPEGRDVLRRWCDRRAPTCAAILRRLPVVDGHVRAHRLIACDPAHLRPDLGVFWTHNLDDWPDPYALWAEGGRDAATIVVEAMIPMEAVDWQTSCLALMDWYCGDCESELRVRPGYPVRVVGCTRLEDDSPVAIPDIEYRT